MAQAPSASRSDKRLLPIVLIAMVLLVAAFIILTASAHAGAVGVGGATASETPALERQYRNAVITRVGNEFIEDER